MPRALRESTALAEASSGDARSGRMLMQFITPGWGSSGYYSPQVLEAAAADRVIPAGTHLYLDHMTETERFERPERSVRDLAAVTVEDARLGDGGALVGEVQTFAPYTELLEQMKDAIGLSISGSATDIVQGEAEGRRGPIIEGLAHVASVDFVTQAGRGGKILEVLESARGEALTANVARRQLREARNVGQWIESRLHLELTQIADEMFGNGHLTREERIALSSAVGAGLDAFTASLQEQAPALYRRDLWDEPEQMLADIDESARHARAVEGAVARGVTEATANETREQLQDAVRAAHGGEDAFVWVRDFDDTRVWFDVDNNDGSTTYERTYSLDDNGQASLSGDRVEVRPETRYVPVNPAGQSTTEESEEDTMPQIEEARLRELEEASGRVPTLESERDTAREERDRARNELAEHRRTNRASEIIRERATAEHVRFSPLEERGLLANLPTGEDGLLDEETFTGTVNEAIATAREDRGEGTVNGLGGGTNAGEVTEADIDKTVAAAFGRQISEKGA